jgi:hypothetical protein
LETRSAFAHQINGDKEKSEAFGEISQLETISHHYRDARLDADLCLSVDRLYAYAAVLDEYARENQSNGRRIVNN